MVYGYNNSINKLEFIVMSAYVISAKHLAVIVNLAVKPFACTEFMQKFLSEVRPLAYTTNGLHEIDQEFRKELQNFYFSDTFRKENFSFISRILAKAIVIGVNSAYPHRDQTDLSSYLADVEAQYEYSKDFVQHIKFMQYLKLLHCYEFQASELEDFNKTLAYRFLQIAYKDACYLTADEYDSYQWAI